MSDKKIVKLVPQQNAVDVDLVKSLETMLEQAKTGEIKTFVAAIEYHDFIGYSVSSGELLVKMGLAAYLQNVLQQLDGAD